MKNLIIINDNYLSYGSSLSREFSKNFKVYEFFYSNRGIFYRFFQKKVDEKRFIKFKELLLVEKCDIVFFLLGNLPFPMKYIELLKKSFPEIKFCVWFYDNISKYKDLDFSNFDLIYTFDSDDLDSLIKEKHNALFLPLFYDDYIYNTPTNIGERKIDFALIGSWNGPNYKNRRVILKNIAKYCKLNGKNLLVIGPHGFLSFIAFFRDLLSAKGFRFSVRPGPVDHFTISRIYQSTKVVLNISADNQFSSIPIRFYEASACGCIIINDSSSAILKETSVNNIKNVVLLKDGITSNDIDYSLNLNANSTLNVIKIHSLSNRVKKISNDIFINFGDGW